MSRLDKMILQLEKYALHIVVGLVVLICIEVIFGAVWAANN